IIFPKKDIMTSSFASRRAPAATPFAPAAFTLSAFTRAPFTLSAFSLAAFTLTAGVAASAAPAPEPALELPAITITGARFASDPALAPIGATVITAADIRLAGVNDVNQAIRKIGGVYGRQSLDGSPDFGLDLRGFGSNSAQNMVVML